MPPAEDEESLRAKVAALEERVTVLRDMTFALEQYIGVLEGPHVEASKRRVAKKHKDRHPYLTFSPTSFLEILHALEKRIGEGFTKQLRCESCGSHMKRRTTFLDVGCGLGDKLCYAANVGYEAHGIEVDLDLVRTMKRNLSPVVAPANHIVRPPAAEAWTHKTLTVYPQDALGFEYAGFDVIFFYRPISDEPVQEKLEKRIWSQADPGAYVIAGLARTTPPASFVEVTKELRCSIPTQCKVYRKKETGGRAKR